MVLLLPQVLHYESAVLDFGCASDVDEDTGSKGPHFDEGGMHNRFKVRSASGVGWYFSEDAAAVFSAAKVIEPQVSTFKK
jgi:hypothetical protein